MAQTSRTDVPEAIPHMRDHVLHELEAHRARLKAEHGYQRPIPPLIVGVQGPQGSGKTYLTSILRDVLQSAPHNLAVAVFSLDDLYLPHEGLVNLAASYPDNALLRGRGQPGTHDVPLGTEVLNKLKRINDAPGTEVELPSFDKSAFDGEGDRALHGPIVCSPVDVVLFEGWCVGFYPVSKEEVERRYAQPVKGLGGGFFQRKGYRLENVLDVNERLRSYVSWWDSFDAFIQIKPPDEHPYTYIYQWRLQQEHNMKARNGGKGMSDDQVEKFVDRYIPGYVFFGGGVLEGYEQTPGKRRLPPWSGHGLQIEIGRSREVVRVGKF
ncbi:P-loop containing nucleoside triphosphate hydrolase protein [Trametes coccinea BRFM310]|uniref:p-loop containing nucleoside triphosphate hydrolase protein n=1 Tax=Trametes coccinea (strain BRFM310) TaxID=1353009 RepID=A0A1Y2IGG7_TRAC3|nr:P-loop containing nucleoside triphosphate hydrolase protein [Trametes coccinea BRFM310]